MLEPTLADPWATSPAKKVFSSRDEGVASCAVESDSSRVACDLSPVPTYVQWYLKRPFTGHAVSPEGPAVRRPSGGEDPHPLAAVSSPTVAGGGHCAECMTLSADG